MSAWQGPDLSKLTDAPNARFAPAPADGVAPEGFFSSSSLPTYVKIAGRWVMPERPRSDCVLVRRGERLVTLEARLLRPGDHVALGDHEDGRDGIFVHALPGEGRPAGNAELAARLDEERTRHGYLLWVLGPEVVQAPARGDLEWLIANGYVQAVFAESGVAARDVEAALHGATPGLGQQLRAINRIRALGGIAKAVDAGVLGSGIMHALVVHHVPFVLAGSLGDDGPLPEVVTDVLAAQDALREHTTQATGVVMIAAALHAGAVGRQLPAFHTHRGELEPMLTVDTDAPDFLPLLRLQLEQRLRAG